MYVQKRYEIAILLLLLLSSFVVGVVITPLKYDTSATGIAVKSRSCSHAPTQNANGTWGLRVKRLTKNGSRQNRTSAVRGSEIIAPTIVSCFIVLYTMMYLHCIALSNKGKRRRRLHNTARRTDVGLPGRAAWQICTPTIECYDIVVFDELNAANGPRDDDAHSSIYFKATMLKKIKYWTKQYQ